jgi:hypothetical protein
MKRLVKLSIILELFIFSISVSANDIYCRSLLFPKGQTAAYEGPGIKPDQRWVGEIFYQTKSTEPIESVSVYGVNYEGYRGHSKPELETRIGILGMGMGKTTAIAIGDSRNVVRLSQSLEKKYLCLDVTQLEVVCSQTKALVDDEIIRITSVESASAIKPLVCDNFIINKGE